MNLIVAQAATKNATAKSRLPWRWGSCRVGGVRPQPRRAAASRTPLSEHLDLLPLEALFQHAESHALPGRQHAVELELRLTDLL